ncbi:MAG: tail fiber domain-containing protein [Bacteroidia bacterium]|nr:tail fiber domain-containing protein [Bacteroidia bacterium]
MNIRFTAPFFLIALFGFQLVWSQNIGINGTGASPNASAMLDVAATNKGLLIPRVALTGTGDVTTITGAATSLLVYNTATVSNVTPGFYYWNGSAWTRFGAGGDWSLTGNAGTTVGTNFLGTTDNRDLAIYTNNTEMARFTTSNRLGINTTAPISPLHVNGHARIGLVNPVNSGTMPGFGNQVIFSGGPGSAAYDSDNSDPIWMARYNAAQDQSELRVNLSDNCSSLDMFVIQAGGSGCAANTVQFQLRADGVALKPGGGSWAALSDRRLKQNIRPYTDGLAALTRIKPVTFEYNGLANTREGDIEYVGVIAQDVAEVAPYMVGQSGEYLSVDPSAFTYMLINAVQEQQKQIEALQEKASEVDQLRSELAEIKAYLEAKAKN